MKPSSIFLVVFAIAGSACNALPVYGEPINHLFKRGNVGSTLKAHKPSKSQRAPVAHAPAPDSTQAPQHMLDHIQALQASHNGQHHGAQEREAVPAQAPQHTLDRIKALRASRFDQRKEDHGAASKKLNRYLEAQENPPPHSPPKYDG